MNCQETQSKLSDYLEDSLELREREELERHLASCAVCEREARLFAQTVRSVANLGTVEPPPGFVQRVMLSVNQEAQKRGFWKILFSPLGVKIPIHATALILVGAFALYVYRGTPPADVDEPEPLALSEADSVRNDAPEKLTGRRQAIRPLPSVAPSPQSMGRGSEFMDQRFEEAFKNLEDATRRSFRDLAMEKKEVLENPGQERESSSVSRRLSVAPTRFELVVSLSPGVGPEDVVRDKVGELVEQVGGGTLGPESAQSKLQESGRSDIFWVFVPPERYDQFKNELASLGTLRAESIFYFSQDEPATKAAGTVPVKVTLLPARR